jgi:hypothetical protein
MNFLMFYIIDLSLNVFDWTIKQVSRTKRVCWEDIEEAENAFMKERDKVQNNIAHHCSKCERKCWTVASMGNRILFVLRTQKYF